MDVDEAADQLYGLAPGDFVEARDALVRQARESGDRELAGAIAALRKPTAVAWLANRLARERPDQLRNFLALGPPLRDASATLSGPALRDLSRQRQALVHALVREARQVVADTPGPRVSEDVARGLEATLHAALADPEAAASVEAGRLASGLSHTGFGAASAAGLTAAGSTPAPAAPPGGATKKASPADRRAAQRAQLDADLAQAWIEEREAAEARDAAATAAAEAATSYDDAHARVGAVQDELRSLQERLSQAERALAAARDERKRTVAANQSAERRAERAGTAVTDLQTRLESLTLPT